jgi:hypothetical protein
MNTSFLILTKDELLKKIADEKPPVEYISPENLINKYIQYVRYYDECVVYDDELKEWNESYDELLHRSGGYSETDLNTLFAHRPEAPPTMSRDLDLHEKIMRSIGVYNVIMNELYLNKKYDVAINKNYESECEMYTELCRLFSALDYNVILNHDTKDMIQIQITIQ